VPGHSAQAAAAYSAKAATCSRIIGPPECSARAAAARARRPPMLENLTQRLSRVVKTLRGEARLTEANIADALREVRLALLEADVALPVVKDFVARVREKAVGEEVTGSL